MNDDDEYSMWDEEGFIDEIFGIEPKKKVNIKCDIDDFFSFDEDDTSESIARRKQRKEQEDMRTLEKMDLSTIEKFLRQKKLNNINKNNE